MAKAKGLHDWQFDLVVTWAEAAPEIGTVRLFGSRWRGDHRSDSDVDLAVTVLDGADEPAFDIYIDRSDQWEAELTKRLGLTIHVQLYEANTSRVAFVACEAGHTLIWP